MYKLLPNYVLDLFSRLHSNLLAWVCTSLEIMVSRLHLNESTPHFLSVWVKIEVRTTGGLD